MVYYGQSFAGLKTLLAVETKLVMSEAAFSNAPKRFTRPPSQDDEAGIIQSGKEPQFWP